MSGDLKKLPLVLHVGYHKTATTYLQKLVFPEHPQLLYAGRPFATTAISDFFLSNQFTHPLDFDPSVLNAQFYTAVEDWVKSSGVTLHDKKCLLISHESLHSGPDWFGSDVVMMADRLNKVFPGAKIIIGIRNQTDYIESNYKEYILHGGKLRYGKFLEDSYAFQYGLLPKLFFDKVITLYRELFGSGNVHVYLLEELKKDPAGILNGIMQFMGADKRTSYKTESVNVGLTRFSSRILRRVNCWLAADFSEQYYRWMHQRITGSERLRRRIGQLLKKLDAGMGSQGKKITGKETAEKLRARFRESNRNLSRMLGRELPKNGYE